MSEVLVRRRQGSRGQVAQLGQRARVVATAAGLDAVEDLAAPRLDAEGGHVWQCVQRGSGGSSAASRCTGRALAGLSKASIAPA